MNTSHEIKMAETNSHAEQQLFSQRNFDYCDKIRPTSDEANPAKSDQSLSFFSLDHPTPFFVVSCLTLCRSEPGEQPPILVLD